MTTPRSRRSRLALGASAVLVLVLAACSGGSSDSSSSTTEARSTTTGKPPSLSILVTNDDGYQAEGIDTLVTALETLDDVEVTVVAPLTQQSGTGGKSTDGKVAVTDVELAGGHAATAVDGFPTDAVRVAVDELGLKPDLVLSGINQGQNLGPAVDLSGTVGAARAAVARGIPALAVSQGSTGFDYDSAVPFVLGWVEDHRAELIDGKDQVEVTNLNVPSCSTGKVRGLAEVPADLTGDLGASAGVQDCASTTPLADLTGDVEAFLAGYATISTVPDEPATPAEVVTTTTAA